MFEIDQMACYLPVASSRNRVTRPVLDRFPVSVTGSFITLTQVPVLRECVLIVSVDRMCMRVSIEMVFY